MKTLSDLLNSKSMTLHLHASWTQDCLIFVCAAVVCSAVLTVWVWTVGQSSAAARIL